MGGGSFDSRQSRARSRELPGPSGFFRDRIPRASVDPRPRVQVRRAGRRNRARDVPVRNVWNRACAETRRLCSRRVNARILINDIVCAVAGRRSLRVPRTRRSRTAQMTCPDSISDRSSLIRRSERARSTVTTDRLALPLAGQVAPACTRTPRPEWPPAMPIAKPIAHIDKLKNNIITKISLDITLRFVDTRIVGK